MMKMCLPTIYRIISNNHSKSFGKTQKCNLFTCHLKLISATHTYRNQEMYMDGYIHKIYMYIGIYLKNEENIKINQDEEWVYFAVMPSDLLNTLMYTNR